MEQAEPNLFKGGWFTLNFQEKSGDNFTNVMTIKT